MISDTNNIGNKQSNMKSGGHKKRKTGNSREDRILKTKLFIAIKFVSLFFFILYYCFNDYLNVINWYIVIFDNVLKEYVSNLLVFNFLREYFFDRSSFYLGERLNDTILNYIDTIYSEKLLVDKVKDLLIRIYHPE